MNRNNKSFHYVYITSNLINGKKYVGQHSTDKLDDGYIGSGRKLLREIKIYGKENFSKKILEYSNSADKLDNLESKYILKNNTLSPNGYNLTSGGESKKEYSDESMKIMSTKAKNRGPMSDETRLKIGESQKGKKHTKESKIKRSESLKGREFSKDHRRKISESHKGMKKPWVKGGPGGIGGMIGEKNGMYGKQHTEETKKIISEKVSKKLKGRKFSEEHKQNISKSKKGKPTFERGIGHKQRFINLYGIEIGIKKYEEFIKKQSLSKKGKKHNYESKSKGIPLMKEHKDKLSKSLKGKKHNLTLLKCPHCGKEGKGGNMTRYHFNNCKRNYDFKGSASVGRSS